VRSELLGDPQEDSTDEAFPTTNRSTDDDGLEGEEQVTPPAVAKGSCTFPKAIPASATVANAKDEATPKMCR